MKNYKKNFILDEKFIIFIKGPFLDQKAKKNVFEDILDINRPNLIIKYLKT